jgi:hypothetical protein
MATPHNLRSITSKRISLHFDAIYYDRSEWEELFSSISAALKAEGLPGLYEDPWRSVENGFLFTGTPNRADHIESILDQFAVRINKH